MFATIRRQDRRWLLGWLAAMLSALAAAAGAVHLATQRHLARDAEHEALHYAQTLVKAVPGLPAYLAGGTLGAGTVADLRRLRHLGDVFRFKLFDREGRLLLVSDQLDDAAAVPARSERIGSDQGVPVEQARTLLQGGRSIVELQHGRGRADRPAVYAEAYVPVRIDGRTVGVVEVYVDQVDRAERAREAYAQVALAMAAVVLALGGLGLAHWFSRHRQQRSAEARMRYLARHDGLSGLHNRASFNEALAQAVEAGSRGEPGFAVLCLDLDRFKEVNDTLGHAAGDEVLRQAAERLRLAVRQDDLVARLGGDEFAVLQRNAAQAVATATLGERIVAQLAAPYEWNGQTVRCGASVGATLSSQPVQPPDLLLHQADLALYRAKTSGRGCFSFYDAALDAEVRSRHQLVRDLREAADRGTLALHYQPLYARDGRTLLGYEALMRWAHPQRGNVPPSEFIPLAEETGLIVPLGAWALHRACADAMHWPDEVSVAVNLSAAQFETGDLPGTVASALAASGLAPSRLELEITESLLMRQPEHALATLRELAGMGVRIAMDDFGTGYSSLAYLWRFPFDKVKIDRAFTHGLGQDPKVNLIVRSIVTLAHALKIRVNAEGVETAEQMAALQQHGCDELQGFMLGRPVPGSALPQLRPAPAGVAAPAAAPVATPVPAAAAAELTA